MQSFRGQTKSPKIPFLWRRRELATGKGARLNFLLHGVSQEQVLKSSRLCWHEQNDGALSTVSAQCCTGEQNKPLLQSVTCAGALSRLIIWEEVHSECSQQAFNLEMLRSCQIFCAAPCQAWADGFWLPDRSCITPCSGHRHLLLVCDAVNSHSLGLNGFKLKNFLSPVANLAMGSPNPSTSRTISMEHRVTMRNPLSGHHHRLSIRGT